MDYHPLKIRASRVHCMSSSTISTIERMLGDEIIEGSVAPMDLLCPLSGRYMAGSFPPIPECLPPFPSMLDASLAYWRLSKGRSMVLEDIAHQLGRYYSGKPLVATNHFRYGRGVISGYRKGIGALEADGLVHASWKRDRVLRMSVAAVQMAVASMVYTRPLRRCPHTPETLARIIPRETLRWGIEAIKAIHRLHREDRRYPKPSLYECTWTTFGRGKSVAPHFGALARRGLLHFQSDRSSKCWKISIPEESILLDVCVLADPSIVEEVVLCG